MASEEQQPKQPAVKTEQEIFEAEVARFSGKAVILFGGLAILAALVMSTVALVQSGNTNTTTVTAPAAASSGPAPGASPPKPLAGSALGKQLFVNGDASTGVTACGGCHALQAAGTTAAIGPNLDKELTSDPPSATRESIVDPNKEIVPGYAANVMPVNYGSALSAAQLDALVKFVYESTNTKAKAKIAATGGA
jgi:mono/diheme cytochrome c family protein